MAADEIIIETVSAEVVEVGVPGPQGPAGAAGTGLETLTTKGDTLYRGTTTGERLPIGTTGQILRVSASGIPEWGAAPASGVISVNNQTGEVFLDSTDILTEQALQISDAGIADCNGVFVYGGLFNGRPTYYATKDTFVYWDGSNWVINHNGDDQYFGTATTYVWQAVWSLGDGANPLPVVAQAASHEFEQVVGQRTNPTARGDAASKNVGTGANDVAAGNHTHAAATQSVAGFFSATDKTKLDGIAAGAEVNVNADWTASSGDAQILNKPTIPTASTATPAALGTAAAGTGTAYAREDHVHAMPSAADVGAAPATNIEQTAINSELGNNDLSEDIDYLNGIVSGLGTAATSDSTDFASATHAASHAAGGSDPLAPSDIGAMPQFAATDQTLTSASTTLTAGRARRINLSTTNSSDTEAVLPTSSNQDGDTFQLIRSSNIANGRILVTTSAGGSTLADLGTKDNAGRSFTFRYRVGPNTWEIVPVDAHSADKVTSGTLDIARIPTGTGSTTVALGDHTHELTALAATGASNGTVLTANGSGGVTFAAASGGDTVSITSSAADVLSVSSGAISAVDATADKIVFYDDSASELTYLELGSGLSISGTTLSATASGGSKTYARFTALDNQPPSANFATLDTRNSIAVLDFDDATDESAVFVSIIPEAASLGSGLKIRLHWMATSATSGNVVWDVSLERMTTDLDSDSLDTIASATAAANGTSGILTVTEITLTTIDSVTAGDGFRLKVTRDANNASDTMTGDAELVVCEVRSAA